MKKRLLCIPLLGILAMSLSSCRSEDTIVQQTQNKEVAKNFAVFTPKKAGETIDYAKGFAYLMQRYDKLQKTNLSGFNNKHIIGNLSATTEMSASIFQDTESYVEFNIHSQAITEENGDKWMVFPKINGNKVIALVTATLTQNRTYVKYQTFGESNEWFSRNVVAFQEALNRFQNKTRALTLNANINPMAAGGAGCYWNGREYIGCEIEGVNISGGKPSSGGSGGGGGENPEPGSGGGCAPHEDCAAPEDLGGSGDYSNYVTNVSPNFRMRTSDQRKYTRFTELIKGMKSYVQNNPIILKKLVEISGLTNEQVLDKLTFGKGPMIELIPGLTYKKRAVMGAFDRTIPDVLYVNENFAAGLEQASLSTTIEATTFLLSVTVLHEFVHHGNRVSGYYPPVGEAGELFENEVYGVVITPYNATDYVLYFHKK
ncbi:hypothetical protein [Elizabethkingia ursingii]|uniref:hypothetical protein n=1 Tax=Elizabethkingia ursingii TaxID=1756150 RepID=UPI002013A0D9|nr:hypothetical protein [Elizabethkingia ursingii]MCL1671473.1 hypothetical protein [Elizabethkingia ursingii]